MTYSIDSNCIGSFEVQGSIIAGAEGSHVETIIIFEFGVNQNHYTFALILLIKSVLRSKFVEPSL